MSISGHGGRIGIQTIAMHEGQSKDRKREIDIIDSFLGLNCRTSCREDQNPGVNRTKPLEPPREALSSARSP